MNVGENIAETKTQHFAPNLTMPQNRADASDQTIRGNTPMLFIAWASWDCQMTMTCTI